MNKIGEKMKKLILLLLLLIFITFGTQKLKSEEIQTVSGEIINGLRTITLEKSISGILTFYRGDYLLINHNEDDTLLLLIDKLDIVKKYPAPPGEKTYVKLKKVGSFEFTFGGSKGIINIVEYTQPQYKAVNAAEAKELIKNLEPLVLDVRTQFEFNRGHLKNAQLIPVQAIQKDYTKLLDHKDKPVFIYCASGNRSTVASKVLIDNGFKRIYNLRYGIKEWQRNGFEIIK